MSSNNEMKCTSVPWRFTGQTGGPRPTTLRKQALEGGTGHYNEIFKNFNE